MFKSLDVLIGFAAILLLVSLAVTALVQTVTTMLGWRGRNLVNGVMAILNQLDPKMTPYCARQIAAAVLRQPLIARAEGGRATVLQREELTSILLELAAGLEPGGKSLDEVARSILKKSLENNGIANPAEVLQNFALTSLKLEAIRPDLPSAARRNLALATEATSQFVAVIHHWFDETMDRVTHRFTRRTRLFTVVIAALVTAGMQLDAFDLLKRLSVDTVTRGALNAMAGSFDKLPAADLQQVAELRKLAESGYAVMPENWAKEWSPSKIPGMVLSVILLSLGAPFWYDALKDLVGLRPVLARKEQANRERRQAAAGPAVPPVPAEEAGEKGDLAATGAMG
jgi:hypothetical protein